MNITIKHAGRKTEITQQSNGTPICKLFCINGIFLHSRTFPNIDQALNFATQWLYDMEDSENGNVVDLLHRWEKSGIMEATI